MQFPRHQQQFTESTSISGALPCRRCALRLLLERSSMSAPPVKPPDRVRPMFGPAAGPGGNNCSRLPPAPLASACCGSPFHVLRPAQASRTSHPSPPVQCHVSSGTTHGRNLPDPTLNNPSGLPRSTAASWWPKIPTQILTQIAVTSRFWHAASSHSHLGRRIRGSSTVLGGSLHLGAEPKFGP